MDEFTLRRARKLLDQGLADFGRGDLVSARSRFRESAGALVTADSLTYWAWMEHQLGATEFAIDLCYQAIEADPTFGNPYNDIGSYLVAQGKLEEAIPWFEKAILAERYEPRQFPHINLGRVYMAKEQPQKALAYFRRALEYDPGNPELSGLVQFIEQTLV